MNRVVKGFWILESEIAALKVIFYTEIALDIFSLIFFALCFVPQVGPAAIIFGVLSALCGGVGIYLSMLQSRIWRHVRGETSEAILGDTDT